MEWNTRSLWHSDNYNPWIFTIYIFPSISFPIQTSHSSLQEGGTLQFGDHCLNAWRLLVATSHFHYWQPVCCKFCVDGSLLQWSALASRPTIHGLRHNQCPVTIQRKSYRMDDPQMFAPLLTSYVSLSGIHREYIPSREAWLTNVDVISVCAHTSQICLWILQ